MSNTMASAHTNSYASPHQPEQVKSQTEQVKDHVKAAASKAEDHISSVVSDVKHASQDVLAQGKQMADTADVNFQRVIRENPKTAALGALGLGILVGMALSRR